MAQRDEDLLRLHEIVAQSGRVDVVGAPGSGRTHLIERLCADLRNDGWAVTQVRGSASLKEIPLAAVLAAGLTGSVAGLSLAASAANCVAELAERSGRTSQLIAVDDWDAVDQASQGVIEQASRVPNTSLVITRRSGWIADSARGAEYGSLAEPTLTVTLQPLHYEELQDILRARLGGEIDGSTMSRIYAKSDGNIALSIAMVDAGVRESRLVKRDSFWVATANMWSPMLTSAAASFLAPLGEDEREAMEVLSLTGVVDLATAVDVVGESAIDALEERQLVRLHHSARGYLVAVTPPLLAEHIRRTQPAARRVRLRGQIERRLAGRDSSWAPLGDELPGRESSAGFVHIIREQQRTQLLITHAAWQHRPTADTAVPYLEALIADNAPAEEIDRLVEQSINVSGGAEGRARLAVLAAQHRAYTDREVDEAAEDLRVAEREVGEFASFVRAWRIGIELALTGVPPDYAQRLSAALGEQIAEPTIAAATRHWVAATAATALGELTSSEEHLDRMRESLGGVLDDRGTLLSGLNMLGFGRLDDALVVALRGIDESRAAFDVEALRRYSYLGALCYNLRGDYAGFERVAEEIFGLGAPPEASQQTQLALVSMSIVIAQRQGKSKLARRYEAQLDRLTVPDGPMPAMVRRLSDIQASAGSQRPAEAADASQAQSDDHWERGYRFSAAFGYSLALELDPTPERFASLRERLEAIEGEFFQAQIAYLQGLADGDPDALMAAADRLTASGRPGQAIAALSRAGELYAAARKAKEAAHAQELAQQLEEATPPGSYAVERYGGKTIRLTSREREIVSLVARGMSNSEIATRLTLSLRTVESHMHHIIAKSGITTRGEFRGLATRLGDF